MALDPGLSRFAWVLLAYVVALAALATLSPFDFDFAHPHGYELYTSTSDVALNLAFLFPVGFLFRLARTDERPWPLAIDALLLGVALSCGLELMQAFLPLRVMSPIDVATNAAGAWLGGLMHSRVGPWLDRRLEMQLSLHLPLANILYLSIPLLALNALCLRQASDALPLLPLALFMAYVAAGLYKHRLEGSARPFPNLYALAVGLLFAIGGLPLAHRALPLWAASVLAMAALTRLIIVVGTRLPERERRFVPWTIQRALPWFVVYLVTLALRALLVRWLPGFETEAEDALEGGQVGAIQLLRDVASFTVLGYLFSELTARSTLTTRTILWRALTGGAALAFGCALVRATVGADLGDNPGAIALPACGAVAGSAIHRSQLRLVKSWARTRPPPPLADSACPV